MGWEEPTSKFKLGLAPLPHAIYLSVLATESCFYRYKNRQTAALLRHQLICSCCPHRSSRSVLLKLAFWHKCFSVLCTYVKSYLQVQAWPGCLPIQFQLSPPRAWACVTWKPHSPLGGCHAKRHNQTKIGRRKDLLFAANKENTGDLSQSSVFLNSKVWEFLS